VDRLAHLRGLSGRNRYPKEIRQLTGARCRRARPARNSA
jgi:hypothetical protein